MTRPTPGGGGASQKRLALVIGNGAYAKVAPLTNPVNDATDMAATLQGLGFEVITATNASLVEMRRAIRQFGEKLERQKGVGLFFYAGHGIEVKGKNYLVPVDAEITREIETEDAAIELDSVLRQLDAAGNGFNIVILDACRNNPFARGWNRAADTGGLANLNAPTGTYIAYAAAPGTTASDGRGTRNGVFTGALIKNLRRPNLKLEEVFKATREEVMTSTGSKQVPWDSSSIKGDFYFKRTEEISAGATAKVDPAAIELEFWETIKDSKDPADFEAYLKEYPKGQYVALARLKATKLNGQLNVPSPAATSITDAPNSGSTPLEKPAESTKIAPGIEIRFVSLPAGEFEMGDNDSLSNGRPRHRVKLSKPFEMADTETTQAQWAAIMGNNPSDHKNCAKCPVDKVSWDKTQEFIRRLNSRADGHLYRLPSEAEWEYAAKAGGDSGEVVGLESTEWYALNSGGQTHEVGTKSPNSWGLYDLNGNVLEWVQDWFAPYPTEAQVDPLGPPNGKEKVQRGTLAVFFTTVYARNSFRLYSNPSRTDVPCGFRLVRQ